MAARSSSCNGRTRSQTSAANGVFMLSKRVKTGPAIVPGGTLQIGLGGKTAKKSLSCCWPSGVAPVAVAAVEQHQRAVLEVVDPALRDGLVVRPVDAGLDRALARGVVVVAARRRAVRVRDLGPDGDVLVAHVVLRVAEAGGLPGRRAGGRGGVEQRRAGVGRRGRRGEDEERDQRHARQGRDQDDPAAVPLDERALLVPVRPRPWAGARSGWCRRAPGWGGSTGRWSATWCRSPGAWTTRTTGCPMGTTRSPRTG